MKRFIKVTVCLLLCILSFSLVGCKNNKKENVDTSVPSNGNGGMVVTQGDYVYFVNGYKTYSTYNKDNLKTKFSVGGLYRAKLNSEGKLEYDENGSVVGATRISDKLVGFESTSLYVFGNNIYYTTPDTEVTKNGELQTSKLAFYKMPIGGGESKCIYKSSNDASAIDYEFYYADGCVYLLVNENGTLKRVNCWGKFDEATVASGITSLVMHTDEYDVFSSDSYKNVFYTKTNDDGKIEIYNYNVASGKNEYKATTEYKTCKLIDYKFKHLYFKASDADYPSLTYVYRMDATSNAFKNLVTDKIADMEFKNFYFLDYETSGYIAQTDSQTYHVTYNAGGEGEVTVLTGSKIEIMTIKNNYIYFKSENTIKRVNYYNFVVDGEYKEETVATFDELKSFQYDIDNSYVYCYATKGSNTYLYGVYINNPMEGEDFETTLFGVYEDGDIEKVEE